MKRFILFIFIISGLILMLSSCLSQKPGPDLPIYECYQLHNESNKNVTFHFYKQGISHLVWAEIWDGSFNVNMNDYLTSKNIDNLWCDSLLILSQNQTALLYFYKLFPHWPDSTAYALINLGRSQIQFFNYLPFLIGDSVTLSLGDKTDSLCQTNNPELWETWYNEQQYIYYHFWRIQE